MLGDSQRRWLLTEVLRETSRAFYLTLAVLPRKSRETLGTAYLVARAADTIADTEALPPEERKTFLEGLRRAIDGDPEPDYAERLAERVAERQHDPGERRLLLNLGLVLELLHGLPVRDLQASREVLRTLTQGMLEDLERDGRPLETAEDLLRYTYLVAGCVGPFWTRICLYHHRALRGWDEESMCRLGLRFGQALQLTNVLRDTPGDIATGRFYLPRQELAELGLTPEQSLQALPLRHRWTLQAVELYRSAQEYALRIPPRCTRLRLAVLWPILIGMKTLARLNQQPGWTKAKVSRPWVYQTMLLSWLVSWNDGALRAWFSRLETEVVSACVRP